MELLAKPTGVSLREHTGNVSREAENLLNARPVLSEKYRALTGADLRRRLLRAARYHDAGKAAPEWQEPCRRDYERYQILTREQRKEFRATALENALFRHEFASLEFLKREGRDLDSVERATIAAHHGKFSYRHEHRWKSDGNDGRFFPFWKEFVAAADQPLGFEGKQVPQLVLERYAYDTVRALLQRADRLASRREEDQLEGKPDSVLAYSPFAYEGPTKRRPVQKLVYEHRDEPWLLLRAPTGSGKTGAAFLWAEYQILTRRADRMVIAMPTRFTSNQLAIGASDSISDVGLYHSTAQFVRALAGRNEETARQIRKDARLLETPVTVCTLDYLLLCVTGRREDHHHTFFNLAHSCVVVDEVDFYDDFTQDNLDFLLLALSTLKVPVLIMSATVPSVMQSYYRMPTLLEERSDEERIRCHLHRLGSLSTAAGLPDELCNRVRSGTPTIIYANTVERAITYYREFEALKPILYHSRFTEPDKERIEQRLVEALGPDAHEKGHASGLAILTQIGELSVNISAKLMISDLCPVDRMAQRVGRLGRFSREGGELWVVDPEKNGQLYPAPYGEYDRKTREWLASPVMERSAELLREGTWNAKQWIDAVDILYPELPKQTPRVAGNRASYHRELLFNWLITPKGQSTLDEEDGAGEWKTRWIDPQAVVLVQPPGEEDLRSWSAFRAFVTEYGVTCPLYERERGVRNEQVFARRVQIGRGADSEQVTVFIAKPLIYDPDRIGLWFGEGAPNESLSRFG